MGFNGNLDFFPHIAEVASDKGKIKSLDCIRQKYLFIIHLQYRLFLPNTYTKFNEAWIMN